MIDSHEHSFFLKKNSAGGVKTAPRCYIKKKIRPKTDRENPPNPGSLLTLGLLTRYLGRDRNERTTVTPGRVAQPKPSGAQQGVFFFLRQGNPPPPYLRVPPVVPQPTGLTIFGWTMAVWIWKKAVHDIAMERETECYHCRHALVQWCPSQPNYQHDGVPVLTEEWVQFHVVN